MKNTLLLTFLMVLGLSCFAQTPTTFNYQSVLRDANGQVLANQDVEIGIAILQSSATGSEVFAETHSVTTNSFGLVNLQIGSVNPTDMQTIDWSAGPYFIQISVDGTIMGASQLLSVPYAIHAQTVENDAVDDADADPANELQQLTLENNELSISDGNSVDLSSLTNIKDTSATNELQQLNLNGEQLEITGGNTVDLSTLVNTKDTSATNELQDISLTGTDLSISDGSTVDLTELLDSTDNQMLEFYSGTRYLYISNGNSVFLPFIISEKDPIYIADSAQIKSDIRKNTQAIIDTAAQIRAALVDTAANLRADLATKVALADTAALLHNEIAVNTQAIIDTALALRTDLATKTALADTATLLHNEIAVNTQAIIDTALALRTDLATKAALADTATLLHNEIAVNTQAIIDTAANLRADLATKAALADTASQIRADMLTSETDPIFNSSLAASITDADTAAWNQDTSATNEIQTLTISNDTIFLSDGGNVKLPATSANIASYGYVYNMSPAGDVIAGGADVVFTYNGPLSGITHTAGLSAITVPTTGVYKIDYSVNINAGLGAAIAIAVNGMVDPSTNVSLLVATGQVSGSAMLSLTAGDVITLRNNSATPFTLNQLPGIGAQLNITLFTTNN